MTDREYIAVLVDEFTRGWRERREYAIRVNQRVELRGDTVRHPPLLAHLNAAADLPREQGGGSAPGKPGSRPPRPVSCIDLLGDLKWLCASYRGPQAPGKSLALSLRALVSHEYGGDEPLRDAVGELRRLNRKAKIILGYIPGTRKINPAAAVCGTCEGTLRTDADVERGEVWCSGTDTRQGCGTVYLLADFLDLVQT